MSWYFDSLISKMKESHRLKPEPKSPFVLLPKSVEDQLRSIAETGTEEEFRKAWDQAVKCGRIG